MIYIALILGLVEGLTEFLPVSSTGHLIVVGNLLHFNDERSKVFEIVIQFAAILAVCWEYREKLKAVTLGVIKKEAGAQQFALNIMIAFAPLAVLGLLIGSKIKKYLFAPIPVTIAFIVGGLIILWAEKRNHKVTIERVEDLKWQDALKMGCAQALALVPGTSRSGATIIGGLFFGLSRKAATEFSFFLAIPTLFAATIYEVIKHHDLFNANDFEMFVVGSVASFISAFFAVKALLRYISKNDFTIFAWYRIAFGILFLAASYFNIINWNN
ncbi:MAG: undecaprenyl-diphosphate phosphatase [Bdellovibrionales bacterium]